ncbi:hypothetical protein DF185_09360 [Marinifilum breve]|uniref:Thioredoxin domain-containing protein n=1 Tax=Marinifilum breve TaxID=2184082 RepID=A0A2V3ZYB6_9BACT|nr:thioredoxin family protein [Marinifilum breve]PXY01665.1 hypothetical protein DF185_09360 [Marinifilum breve]
MRANFIKILYLIMLTLPLGGFAQQQVKVKLKGVYDSRITLSPQNGMDFSRPIKEYEGVKKGQQVLFTVPDSLLPGEFNLEFRSRLTSKDNPYPSRLSLFLNKKDSIRVLANPLFLQGDSLLIENGRENNLWDNFMQEAQEKKQQIGLLQQLLEYYSEKNSPVWKTCHKTYNKKVAEYNQWVDQLAEENKDLFVAGLLKFQSLPKLDYKKSKEKQLEELKADYFNDFDFSDTLQLRSKQVKNFLAGYVNLHGGQAKTMQQADSIMAQVAQKALTMAAKGNPQVYGFFADYFFTGFETYGFTKGIEVVNYHSDQDNCFTNKKKEILRRVAGMKNMKVGITAPPAQIYTINQTEEEYLKWDANDSEYQLLVFYDHECSHCEMLMDELKSWIAKPENNEWVNIVSIGLDKTHQQWLNAAKMAKLPWTDTYARGGINSQVAENYYILSSPTLVVVNKNGKISALPKNMKELNQFLNKVKGI